MPPSAYSSRVFSPNLDYVEPIVINPVNQAYATGKSTHMVAPH